MGKYVRILVNQVFVLEMFEVNQFESVGYLIIYHSSLVVLEFLGLFLLSSC